MEREMEPVVLEDERPWLKDRRLKDRTTLDAQLVAPPAIAVKVCLTCASSSRTGTDLHVSGRNCAWMHAGLQDLWADVAEMVAGDVVKA
jgi:hypothetical protein